MKLLAADTSGPVCGVAVMEDDRVLCEYTVQNSYTHSASLMPMVERSLESAGVSLAELDALAVVTGPGSFTGVRIGVATIKGLAHGSGKPCIPVNALEALALSAGGGLWQGAVCPIQDARAGQVYGACFLGEERRMEDAALKLEDYLARVSGLTEAPLLFTGDGVRPHRARIREILGERAFFAPGPFCYLRPSAAGSLAVRKGQAVSYPELKETYLRPPNAEKNKKLLEAMRHG